ncbi:MAG TPA: hypothetical protein VI078_16805 [bacterium]
MKAPVLALTAVLGAAAVLAAAAPARAEEDFCPMGGMQVKAEVNRDKAIAWAKERRNAAVVEDEGGEWSVVAQSAAGGDIAILVQPGFVFVGIAGKGNGEIDAREAEKAFGRELRDLADAVKKDLDELQRADVVNLDRRDVADLAAAVALGVFAREGREWKHSTVDCVGTDVDTSALEAPEELEEPAESQEPEQPPEPEQEPEAPEQQ